MRTIRRIITDVTGQHNAALEEALVEREDEIAHLLRLWGAMFGAQPALTARALMEIGVGTPVSNEAKALLTEQSVLCVIGLHEQLAGRDLSEGEQQRVRAHVEQAIGQLRQAGEST